MSRALLISIALLLAPGARAEDASKKPAGEQAKALAGISILGNQEAPKSLVIVPWKS